MRTLALWLLLVPTVAIGQDMAGMPSMAGMIDSTESPSGRSILPMMKHPMMPGLEGVRPSVGEVRLHTTKGILEAKSSDAITIKDGDTVAIEAGLVRRTINGKTLIMYAFNGQAPGPLLRAHQGATFYVKFHNAIDRPATIHWHGVRLNSAFDGIQPPVAAGGTFLYQVHCPDAGIFWYHDHVREDIGQPMGLYGNIDVEPATSSVTTRRAFVILSDILVDGDSLIAFGDSAPNFALMGRFGNVILVNGEPRWHFDARPGEVVRFLLTNASSARTYNLSFGDAPMKLVASDQGPYQLEMPVQSVVIAPGERYVVDVKFPGAGKVTLVNAVQEIDHFLGEFHANVDTLGVVTVAGSAVAADTTFTTLHKDAAMHESIERVRSQFDRPPDEEVVLTTAIQDLPIPVMQFMSVDTLFRPALEWTDGMADMNWVSTGREVRWVIRDARTKAENMGIHWQFARGSLVKLRIYNDPRSLHPMDHPIHLHGQRFLVVARDSEPNPYLVWKDTAIIPVGSTVDLLVDMSNPGTWMMHCHIAEHIESGMMAAFTVSTP